VPRTRTHDDELRSRLLVRAAELLVRNGVSGVSLRALAADVGTSTTAVYALFGGKPGLLETLLADAFRRLGSALAAVPASSDPVADLLAVCRAYRDAALDAPHVYHAMFDPAAAPADPEATGTAFAPLRAAAERAIDAKGLRYDADPATVTLSLWATLHGLVMLRLRGAVPPGVHDPAAGFDATLNTVVDGWRP
jgi:AcrR family transcriptional regulator